MGLDGALRVAELTVGARRNEDRPLGPPPGRAQAAPVAEGTGENERVGAGGNGERTGGGGNLGSESRRRKEGPAHRKCRRLQLLVDPGGQEGLQGVVGHHVGDDQAGGDDAHQQQEQAEPQGHEPTSPARRPEGAVGLVGGAAVAAPPAGAGWVLML